MPLRKVMVGQAWKTILQMTRCLKQARTATTQMVLQQGPLLQGPRLKQLHQSMSRFCRNKRCSCKLKRLVPLADLAQRVRILRRQLAFLMKLTWPKVGEANVIIVNLLYRKDLRDSLTIIIA